MQKRSHKTRVEIAQQQVPSPQLRKVPREHHSITPLTYLTLPNVISLLRILLVPFIIYWLVKSAANKALIGFIVASLSDAIDGFLARKFKVRTLVGAYLDPLADKILLIALYATFAYQEHIPFWLAISVILRDLLIMLGIYTVRKIGHTPTMQPVMISKVNTALELILAFLILLRIAHYIHLPLAENFLAYMVLATTLLYIYDYIKIAVQLSHQKRSAHEK